MLYVFSVHSPITFLMSLSIIRQNNINERDVLILAFNYKLPFIIGKEFRAYSEVYKSPLKKLFNWNVAKSFDNYIKKITNDSAFIAYIDIMHNYQKLLITNINCKHFNFFEEGTDSYMSVFNLKDFTRTATSFNFRSKSINYLIKDLLRTTRGFSSAIHSLPYNAQFYQFDANRKYFCLSAYCYPEVAEKSKIVIQPKLSDHELNILSSGIKLSNEILIIEETYPELFEISDNIYLDVVKKTLSNFSLIEGQNIYLKLRPNRKLEASKIVQILNQLNINYIVLPPSALAEAIFLNSNGLIVVGFVSSLLMYASILGHKSYSMLGLLDSKPNSRFDSINGFNKLVQKI